MCNIDKFFGVIFVPHLIYQGIASLYNLVSMQELKFPSSLFIVGTIQMWND